MLLNKRSYSPVFLFFLCQITFAYEPTRIPDVNLKSSYQTKQNVIQLGTTYLTKEKITKSPVVNLSELFKQEQSIVRVTHSSSDATQTALSIRGFGDNAAANSLILVDGFSFTNPSLLAPQFNSIPLLDIDHIEIFEGSEGTLWGNQAVGGVVNIITKHPRKFFISSILGGGSYHKTICSFLLGDYFQNGLYIKVYGVSSATRNARPHNRQDDNNIGAELGLDYARGMIAIAAQSYADKIFFPGGLTAQQFRTNPHQANDFKDFSHYRTNYFKLMNKHVFNENFVLETRIFHHDTRGDGFIFFNFNRHDSLSHLNPRLLGNLFTNKIIIGYVAEASGYQINNKQGHSETKGTANHFYLQTIIPITSRLNFTLGARKAWQHNSIQKNTSEKINSTNDVFVSEQGLSFHPNSDWTFFVRHDGNFSFPKANEELWVPASLKFLQVQTGTSYEAGVIHQNEKQKSQLNIYRLELHNEIAFNPIQTQSQPFGAFNNLDNTTRLGVSLSQSLRLSAKATLDGQFNFVDARFANGPEAQHFIPAVPQYTGNAGFRYAFTDAWQTRYDLLYGGSRFASEDTQNISRKNPGYWLNNMTIQYFSKYINANFEIINFFNQRYSTYTFFNTNNKTNIYYPGPGRNYLLTLKINID